MTTKSKNTTENIEVKETVKKSTPKRVVVDRTTEVMFMNNTNGNLFYKCPKTHATYDMYEYGDTDYITVEQLMIMNNTSRKMLKELWILLLDVVSDGVTLDDVLKYLGIEKLYSDDVAPEDIDNFILKSPDNKFANTLKKMDKVLGRKVVERSLILYREGKFNSLSKSNALKDYTNNEDLFE